MSVEKLEVGDPVMHRANGVAAGKITAITDGDVIFTDTGVSGLKWNFVYAPEPMAVRIAKWVTAELERQGVVMLGNNTTGVTITGIVDIPAIGEAIARHTGPRGR